jgi:hypothetical protein
MLVGVLLVGQSVRRLAGPFCGWRLWAGPCVDLRRGIVCDFSAVVILGQVVRMSGSRRLECVLWRCTLVHFM